MLSHQQSPQRNNTSIDQIRNADEWSQLLQYYRQCLIVENRQQFIIERNGIQFFSTEEADVHKFMRKQRSFIFPAHQLSRDKRIATFIARGKNKPRRQLCLGYPLLVLENQKLAPLIYCPVEVLPDGDGFILNAEDFEISYAALKSCKADQEEIEHYLVESAKILSTSGQDLSTVQDYLLQQMSDLLQRLIERSGRLTPYTYSSNPGLFWVDPNIYTASLIQELQDLSDTRLWERVPEALKILLSVSDEYEYPARPTFEDDPNIYVTSVNDSQVHATTVAQKELLTVVTGPPGTGKSQLVLNIIANAFLRGESVLFASRNNLAVDVVMNRLVQEVGFQGAIRTGKKSIRQLASKQIEDALNQLDSYEELALDDTREDYNDTRLDVLHAQQKLERIREQKGLLYSYQVEAERRLGLLPRKVTKFVKIIVIDFDAGDIARLQGYLEGYIQDILALKTRRTELVDEYRSLCMENETNDSYVTHVLRVQDQHGSLGTDYLSLDSNATVRDLADKIGTWQVLVDALFAKFNADHWLTYYFEMHDKVDEIRKDLPGNIAQYIENVGERCDSDNLAQTRQELLSLREKFSRLDRAELTLWERLLDLLRRDLVRVNVSAYLNLQSQLVEAEIVSNEEILSPNAECFALSCGWMAGLAEAAENYKELSEAEAKHKQYQSLYEEKMAELPDSIRLNLLKIKPFEADPQPLQRQLKHSADEVQRLQSDVDALGGLVNALIDQNRYMIQVLDVFRLTEAAKHNRLWMLAAPCRTVQIEGHLEKWYNLVEYWIQDVGGRHCKRNLSELPTEEEAFSRLKLAQEKLLSSAGRLLRHTWRDRAGQLSNSDLQGIRNYATAIKILTGPYDPSNYRSAKRDESTHLHRILNAFPVWATTNLSTKTNFPLESGLFDLVIIDEASQCDVPSALPLLFRAKRAVVIGDPNQLRHVATISETSDVETAKRYGVGLDAFQYGDISLYDRAERSIGARPGPILLNEHYRSDARIITFSNQEFYANKLIVKTDLTLLGFRKSFLNEYGGMYWLHVDGETRHPNSGSAYNLSELDVVKTMLPKLVSGLNENGLANPSIGIVTPYREQAERIGQWIGREYGQTHHIIAGTAHKYQGDERDFMIFSPVLASGIRQGSLNWLECTPNLLNVAVTRARVGVLIVGDWNYCSELPKEHPYRRLADYVDLQQDRLYDDIDKIPLLGGPPVEIVGYIADPHNPKHNRATLRCFLSSVREYIWWIDSYFDDRVLNLFWDIFQDTDTKLREVKLLTLKDQVESKRGEKSRLKPFQVANLQNELSARGISFEVRVISKSDSRIHDRYIFTPAQVINAATFAGAYGDHKHTTEFTRSHQSPEYFESLWDKATPVG